MLGHGLQQGRGMLGWAGSVSQAGASPDQAAHGDTTKQQRAQLADSGAAKEAAAIQQSTGVAEADSKGPHPTSGPAPDSTTQTAAQPHSPPAAAAARPQQKEHEAAAEAGTAAAISAEAGKEQSGRGPEALPDSPAQASSRHLPVPAPQSVKSPVKTSLPGLHKFMGILRQPQPVSVPETAAAGHDAPPSQGAGKGAAAASQCETGAEPQAPPAGLAHRAGHAELTAEQQKQLQAGRKLAERVRVLALRLVQEGERASQGGPSIVRPGDAAAVCALVEQVLHHGLTLWTPTMPGFWGTYLPARKATPWAMLQASCACLTGQVLLSVTVQGTDVEHIDVSLHDRPGRVVSAMQKNWLWALQNAVVYMQAADGAAQPAELGTQAIQDMPTLPSEADKLRAWIRAGLNERSLGQRLQALVHRDALQQQWCNRCAEKQADSGILACHPVQSRLLKSMSLWTDVVPAGVTRPDALHGISAAQVGCAAPG